jgi:hypothetical protein
MNQFAILHRLKRINARLPISYPSHPRETSKSVSDDHVRGVESVPSRTVNRMIRILLGDPLDDYNYVSCHGGDLVATGKASYFKLVNIRQCHSPDAIEQSRLLSRIHSPNIATVYGLYCDGNKIFVVTEHLDIFLSQLEVWKYELEEWEMATIIAEVYATSSCKHAMLTVLGIKGDSLYLLAKALLQKSFRSEYQTISRRGYKT